MLKRLLKIFLVIFTLSAGSHSLNGELCNSPDHGVNSALELKRSKVVKLPRKKAHQRIPNLVVPLRGENRKIELIPYSVKSKNFRLLVEKEGELIPKAVKGGNTTFRGYIPSMPDAFASASYCKDGWHVRILAEDGQEYWLEPLKESAGEADQGDHVLYESKDVISAHRTCQAIHGLETAVGDSAEPELAEQANGNYDNLVIADIACDADYEFFVSRGSDIDATVERIESIINTVNVQYERDVGISHRISTIIVRSNSDDPYTKTDSHEAVNEFRNHWIYNHADIDRDVAHLFTGKNLQGNTIGVAYMNAICSSYAYGLSQANYSNNYGSITNLVAHELGHNWGADHCNCPNHTMNPSNNSSNVFNAGQTIPQILTFRDSLYCLDAVGDTSPEPPSNLLAIASDHQTIEITWEDNSTTEIGTEIERSADGIEWNSVATVGENVNQYTDTAVEPATTYVYRVSAFNIVGDSYASNLVLVATPEGPFIFAGDSQLEEGSDWYLSDWLGEYWGRRGSWFYHHDLGFICVDSNSTEDDFWFWDLNMGWIWTNKSIWPYCFRNETSNWYYCKSGNGEPSNFYKVRNLEGTL